MHDVCLSAMLVDCYHIAQQKVEISHWQMTGEVGVWTTYMLKPTRMIVSVSCNPKLNYGKQVGYLYRKMRSFALHL